MSERKIIGIIWKCTLCGFCPKDFECPGFDDDARWESSYARGKVAIVHAIIQDETRGFQNSQRAKESLFACTGCGHCQYICPSGIDIPSIIYYGKKKLVDANNYPKTHYEILKNIKKFGNPFKEEGPRDELWLDLKTNLDTKTVYFPGCMAIYRTPEVAINTIKLFEKIGEKIRILEKETCCSGILYRTGHKDKISENVNPMIEDLIQNPPKQIIFTCPGCLTAFKEIYKSVLKIKFPNTKLLHFTEYLINNIEKLESLKSEFKDLLTKKIREPIIWHDPCHLARGLGIYNEPRRILETIGIPYIEFKQAKEDTNCCGSGSGVRSAYPDLAEKTTLQRLKEVRDLGAKTILTACPFCEYQYNKVIKKHNYDYDVLDLNSLLKKLISL